MEPQENKFYIARRRNRKRDLPPYKSGAKYCIVYICKYPCGDWDPIAKKRLPGAVKAYDGQNWGKLEAFDYLSGPFDEDQLNKLQTT